MIQQALFLPHEGHRVVQVLAGAESGGRATFDSYSIPADTRDPKTTWNLHATGRIVHADSLHTKPMREHVNIDEIRAQTVRKRTRDEFYQIMRDRDLLYGPSFQVLGTTEAQDSSMIVELEIPPNVLAELDKYHLHPVLGDACMQTTAGAVPVETDGDFSPYTYVPVGVESVRFLRDFTVPKYCYAVRTSQDDQPSPESVTADAYLLDADGNVLVEFKQVTVQRIGSVDDDSSENVDDWLYQIAWENKPLATATAEATLAGKILLLADDSGVAEELAKQLENAGATCVQVVPGEAFARPTAKGQPYSVRPTSDEDFAALLQDACGAEDAQCAGVIHCWGLSTGNPDQDAEKALEKARDLCCASVLRLIQQVARGRFTSPPPLWLVTRDAQSINGTDAGGFQQAPTWGMGRVAAMEHPELACRLVDLDPNATAATSSTSLFAEISNSAAENQIAYRGDQRYVARLQSVSNASESEPSGQGLAVPADGAFQLRIVDTGSFDSLRYKTYQPPEPAEGQVEIKVAATGLNFSDVLKAMGLYPGITDTIVPIGIECSGVVSRVGSTTNG